MASKSNISVTGGHVKNIVTRFRSIHISQIPYFFPDNVKSGKSNLGPACKFISSRNYIDMHMETGILTAVGCDPDQKQIDCIWAAIDMLSNETSDQNKLDKLLKSVVSTEGSPESICFVAEGTRIVRVIALENEHEVLNAVVAQTHICNIQNIPETDAGQSEYTMLIVIRDRKLLGYINNAGLKIPHKIALLEGGLLEKPNITYFGKS